MLTTTFELDDFYLEIESDQYSKSILTSFDNITSDEIGSFVLNIQGSVDLVVELDGQLFMTNNCGYRHFEQDGFNPLVDSFNDLFELIALDKDFTRIIRINRHCPDLYSVPSIFTCNGNLFVVMVYGFKDKFRVDIDKFDKNLIFLGTITQFVFLRSKDNNPVELAVTDYSNKTGQSIAITDLLPNLKITQNPPLIQEIS